MKLKKRFTRLLVFGLVLVPVLVLGAPTHAEIEAGIKIDCFSSDAQVTMSTPWGFFDVELSGPTVVRVLIGPNGEADDSDNDGLDEVETEIVSMELTGATPLGPIVIRTSPILPSTGEIEELQNITPGILDVPPFGPPGSAAESFFDVFFEIEIGGQVLHNEIPALMYALIDHKPPLPGTTYQSMHVTPIPLVDEAGEPTEFEMVTETHTVGPPCPVEVGGEVYPVNKLAILAPWIVLVAALIVGTAVVVRRRRAQS